MSKGLAVILFLSCVFISACSQILLKTAAVRNHKGLSFWFNKKVIIGYSIFILVVIGTTTLYRYIDLSLGVLLDSASYIFIPTLSYMLLKEKISKKTIAGILFIISGIILGAFL
jgi:drug/metabolite transporter (DMT)-like permease